MLPKRIPRTGPATFAVGIALLAFQVYLWQTSGLLSALLIGIGVGLTFTGAGYWFYQWDDQRHHEPFSVEDHDDIDADEYDRRFEAFEEDEPN